MSTATSLIHAMIAKTPISFVALVTFPKAAVSLGTADVAEESRLQSTRRVVTDYLSVVIRSSTGSRWALVLRRY